MWIAIVVLVLVLIVIWIYNRLIQLKTAYRMLGIKLRSNFREGMT